MLVARKLALINIRWRDALVLPSQALLDEPAQLGEAAPLPEMLDTLTHVVHPPSMLLPRPGQGDGIRYI